jgi:hypothetical protein
VGALRITNDDNTYDERLMVDSIDFDARHTVAGDAECKTRTYRHIDDTQAVVFALINIDATTKSRDHQWIGPCR